MISASSLVVCGVGVLLLRLGMAIHEMGMVRSKNSAGVVLRKSADFAVAVLAFYLVGAMIFFPAIRGGQKLEGAVLFFFMAVTTLATGIVSGASSERTRFWPGLCAPLVLAGVVVPLVFRWTHPTGWLEKLGFIDHARVGAVHLAGGLCAAVLAIAVGARMGKYNRDGSSTAIPGHSLPLAGIGVLLMTVGWFPYVLGFARTEEQIGQVALNTLLAGAGGLLASLLLSQFRYGKPDIHLTYAGWLGALVAVSSSAGQTSPLPAIAIGATAGLIVPLATLIIDLILRIDDPTGAIAIHAVGGSWGIVSAGLFAASGTLTERAKILGTQVLGLIVIAALTLAVSAAVIYLVRSTVGLRSKEADEFDGLDLAEHDIGAYPDFQQTTIKSYHLREA